MNRLNVALTLVALVLAALLIVFVGLIGHAYADTWTVNYFASNSTPGSGGFYGTGTYDFLVRGDVIQVYRLDGNWIYLGVYGQVPLPAGFPPVVALTGFDQIIVSPGGSGSTGGGGGGGVPTVGAPELLEVLRAPDVYAVRAMQKASAITAAGILYALHVPVARVDTSLHLPWVTVEVYRQCAGLSLLAVLLSIATVAAFTARLAWRHALITLAMAFPLAIFLNAVRIAHIAIVGHE